jgi:hypothetical protein
MNHDEAEREAMRQHYAAPASPTTRPARLKVTA